MEAVWGAEKVLNLLIKSCQVPSIPAYNYRRFKVLFVVKYSGLGLKIVHFYPNPKVWRSVNPLHTLYPLFLCNLFIKNGSDIFS